MNRLPAASWDGQAPFKRQMGVWAALLLLAVLGGWLAARPAPFHEDEAIYAAWARRIAHGEDLFLSTTPVDKPPLFLYALAGMFRPLGETPTTARLLNVVVVLGVGLTISRLSRRPAVGVAVLVTTPLVPFLGASAFTDPLMLWLLLLGWRFGRAGRPGTAGLMCGLAVAVKPTAVFLWPLVAAASIRRRKWEEVRAFTVGIGAVLALLWAWDASRSAPSWWQLGREAYGTLGRSPVSLEAWWQPAVLSLGASWIALGWHRERLRTDAEYAVAWGLAVGWIPVHALAGFQPWDRYLLPLAALVAWLAAEAGPHHRVAVTVTVNLALIVLLLLVPRPLLAGRDGRWNGIEEVAMQLRKTEGLVYHHEMGRPLAFYAPDLENRLVWLPEGALPPSGTLWAGRLRDPACTNVLWQAPESDLALCRVESGIQHDSAPLVGSARSP